MTGNRSRFCAGERSVGWDLVRRCSFRLFTVRRRQKGDDADVKKLGLGRGW